MPIFALTDELLFPPPELADENGVLAVGGDLRPERLLLAYEAGIFPWPHEGYPLLWFSLPERFVLEPSEVHLGRSLQKAMRKSPYEIRFDTCFSQVMRGCKSSSRPGQQGTWITEAMIEGYSGLHQLGYAHSAEAFENGKLVGGAYGVSIGGTFCGESMFANATNASKIAFATLIAHLIKWDFALIDCQAETEHLTSFGAKLIDREVFLAKLRASQKQETRKGTWQCEMQPDEALRFMTLAREHKSR